MGFKLFSKNNFGVVAFLLLAILLSQSRLLDLLFETILGRSVLVLFILLIAYTNKIMGVVAVLFIIIAFNNSYTSMTEGFTDVSGNVDVSGNTVTGKSGNVATISKGDTTVTNASGQTATAGSGQIAKQVKSTLKAKATGAEGFDLIGTENNIKRGKQSNTIPVNNYTTNSDNVSAFDGSFSDSYSKF
jgi:hypothetical protein